MSSTSDLTEGVTIAIIGFFISFTLFFAYGIPAENLMNEFESGNYFEVSAAWSSYDDVIFFHNLGYIAAVMPALAGIIILFLKAVRRERKDKPEDMYYTGSYETDYD